MDSDKIIPNNIPEKYKEKLIRFIEHVGGAFACLYYKPLRARIVNPENFTTMYIVNLENGDICVPRKVIAGNLMLDGFFETDSD